VNFFHTYHLGTYTGIPNEIYNKKIPLVRCPYFTICKINLDKLYKYLIIHVGQGNGIDLNRRVVLALVVGLALYVLVLIDRSLRFDLTGTQLILMLVAPFVVGFISGGIKVGIILSFLLGLILQYFGTILIIPGLMADINVALTLFVMFLPWAAISVALGGVGGFLGRRLGRQTPKK